MQGAVGFFYIHSGLYLSNFIRGVEVLAIESTTVLMHRYIESRPPVAFFNSSRGVRNFRGGSTPQPPTNTALYSFNYKFTKESSGEKNNRLRFDRIMAVRESAVPVFWSTV